MTIKVGESGKLIAYNANFDISAFTLLEIILTDPNGTSVTITSADRVSAPATNGTFKAIVAGVETDVTYTANEYMQFTSLAADFAVKGTWTMCGKYTNTVPAIDEIFEGTAVEFEVYEAC